MATKTTKKPVKFAGKLKPIALFPARLATPAEVAALKPEDDVIEFPYATCKRGDFRLGRVAIPGPGGEWISGPWHVAPTYVDLDRVLSKTLGALEDAAKEFMRVSYYRVLVARFDEVFRFEIEAKVNGFVFSSNSGVGVREHSPVVPFADTSKAYADLTIRLNDWVRNTLIEVSEYHLNRLGV